MSNSEEVLRCLSCDFSVPWDRIMDVSRREDVLESPAPAGLVADLIQADKLCCRLLMYHHRVGKILESAMKNYASRKMHTSGDLSGDAEPLKNINVYPDL